MTPKFKIGERVKHKHGYVFAIEEIIIKASAIYYGDSCTGVYNEDELEAVV